MLLLVGVGERARARPGFIAGFERSAATLKSQAGQAIDANDGEYRSDGG